MSIGVPRPKAVYPMNGITRGNDIKRGNDTLNKNTPGIFRNIKFDEGPDRLPAGSMRFKGKRNSYMLIPNRRRLDFKNSMTVLMWVKPYSAGPLLHYRPGKWAVHIWMISNKLVFVRFVPRSGRVVRFVFSNHIKPGRWNYLGASYDRKRGLATVWINGIPIAQRYVGRYRLATNYPIVIGRKLKDRRFFTGSISCLQFYNIALTGQQIKAVKKNMLPQK